MKNKIIASVIFGFCLLFVMQTAIADAPTKSKDTMKISVAVQKLQEKGYKNIHEIKFKNGFYEAAVFTPEGNKLEIRVNTKTGEVETPKEQPKLLSILDIIKKVQAAGYRDIYEIKFDDGDCEVAAVSKDGKDVKLEIKTDTGKIVKDWF